MIKISEEKDLKREFGYLGMYLIDKAQNEIKNLNQRTLFQKAEIKNMYKERIKKRSEKIKDQFIKDYNQKLNNKLTETILKSNEMVLSLKNRLIIKLKEALFSELEQKIDQNYPNYIDYLIKSLKNIKDVLGNLSKVIIYLNKRDYDYFSDKDTQLKDLFGKNLSIEKTQEEYFKGFILESKEESISYNYSFKDLIQQNLSMIEIKFTNLISESQIEDLQNEFEKIIQKEKENINEYLEEYARI
ncbi:MAG: hypothetical protein P8Y70_17750 [Candidatus Lokiarchaeota archaeon]